MIMGFKKGKAYKGFSAWNKNKHIENIRGEKHPRWKGGTSDSYCYRICKDSLERKCNICLSRNDLVIHHIDRNHKHNELNNLMIVCKQCHYNIHKIKLKGV